MGREIESYNSVGDYPPPPPPPKKKKKKNEKMNMITFLNEHKINSDIQLNIRNG